VLKIKYPPHRMSLLFTLYQVNVQFQAADALPLGLNPQYLLEKKLGGAGGIKLNGLTIQPIA
jgi:hypothetical protein